LGRAITPSSNEYFDALRDIERRIQGRRRRRELPAYAAVEKRCGHTGMINESMPD